MPERLLRKLLEHADFLERGMPLLRLLVQDPAMRGPLTALGADASSTVARVTTLPFTSPALIPQLKLTAVLLRAEPPGSGAIHTFLPWAFRTLQSASAAADAEESDAPHLLRVAQLALATTLDVCSAPGATAAAAVLRCKKHANAVLRGFRVRGGSETLLATLVLVAALMAEDSTSCSQMLDDDVIPALLLLLRKPFAPLCEALTHQLDWCAPATATLSALSLCSPSCMLLHLLLSTKSARGARRIKK